MLHLIAHNIRSAENVGSLLRTCDSLGVAKLWITGYSPTPAHRKVGKTALGAQQSVDWENAMDVTEVIEHLRQARFRIVGLELADGASDIVEYRPQRKTALLLGNEVSGIAPSLLQLCDDVVCIRQHGAKESMNVSVAAGIAAFWLMNR